MCGLVGVYCFDPNRPIDRALFLRQTDALAHRGPDAGAVFLEPGIALGHRRLSIIDVGGGAQPMWDVEQRIGVIFNGEIYNYRELREDLSSRGHRFTTDSDTETIIHAFREWGEACVQRLRGMFAFAVYDRRTRDLLLARDRLGKKPLYWTQLDGRLIFASELKAILEDPTVPRAIEPTAVLDFFAYNYVPGPGTILQGLNKLPAGHLMIVKGGQVAVREYWDLDFSATDGLSSLGERADALEAELDLATRLRLRSDVPLGAFLSGGIDSSLVVGLMSKALERPVKTHTIGFTEAEFDERAYAQETAALFHTDHVEKVVAADATEVLDKLSWFYDEPFGDSSALPTYYLCGATRERVTVALSGDGGDESFAGYRRYVFAMYEDQVRRRVPSLLLNGLVSPLARLYPKADYLPQVLRAKATLTNLAVSHERAYFLSLTQKSYPRFLSTDFLRAVQGYDPYTHFERHFQRARTDDPLARLQYVDFKTYLTDDILVKVDRASMAHALEVRVPLLDHRVVERAAAMPSSAKLDGQRTKIVLKEVARRHLPDATFERKKMGFSLPLAAWFRGGLKDRAQAVLFDSPGGHSNLLDSNGLRRLWYEHQLGIANHATSLWSLLMFEAWFQRFLGRARASAPTFVKSPTTVMSSPVG